MPVKIRLREDNLVNGFMTMMARHLDEDAEEPRPFDPNGPEGYWIRYLLDVQNTMNRPQLGE